MEETVPIRFLDNRAPGSDPKSCERSCFPMRGETHSLSSSGGEGRGEEAVSSLATSPLVDADAPRRDWVSAQMHSKPLKDRADGSGTSLEKTGFQRAGSK